MRKHRVYKSFWVKNDSNVNWDTEEFGREGVGIPISKLNIMGKSEQIEITIINRGLILRGTKEQIMKHHQEWDTTKTAPRGANNLYVIVPILMLDQVGFTKAKQKKLDRKLGESLPKSPQLSLL